MIDLFYLGSMIEIGRKVRFGGWKKGRKDVRVCFVMKQEAGSRNSWEGKASSGAGGFKVLTSAFSPTLQYYDDLLTVL